MRKAQCKLIMTAVFICTDGANEENTPQDDWRNQDLSTITNTADARPLFNNRHHKIAIRFAL
jgi:hypothetical protein